MKEFKSGSIVFCDKGKPHEYEYFLPEHINKNFVIDNNKILVSLEEATRLLGELNAYGTLVPDVNFFMASVWVGLTPSPSGEDFSTMCTYGYCVS
jgi:hypothetical protein